MQSVIAILLLAVCTICASQGEKLSYDDWLSDKATILEKRPTVEVTWNAYSPANQLAENQNEAAASLLAAVLFSGQDVGIKELERRRDEVQKRRFTNFGSRLEPVPENPEVAHNTKLIKAMRYGKKK